LCRQHFHSGGGKGYYRTKEGTNGEGIFQEKGEKRAAIIRRGLEPLKKGLLVKDRYLKNFISPGAGEEKGGSGHNKERKGE